VRFFRGKNCELEADVAPDVRVRPEGTRATDLRSYLVHCTDRR